MARVDKKYISSVSMLDHREILNKVLDIENEEWNFIDIMEYLNRYEVTAVPAYHNYVNESVYKLSDVAAAGGAGGATTVTVTFDSAADIRVGQLCFDHNATYPVVGRVKSISTNDVVIDSVDGATNLTFTNAQQVSFFSNAAGEGSGSPAALRTDLAKYYNLVQIFKEKFRITDIQKTSKIEVEFGGDNYWMFKGQHDALLRFRSDIAFALLLGQISDENFAASSPSLVDSNSNPVQTTRGLDQYVVDKGVNQTTAATTAAIADFRTLTKELDKRRAPIDFLVLCSSEMNIQLDDLFNATQATPDLDNARYSVDGRNVDLGIDSWRVYGRTYSKKWLPMLDHEAVTNFTDAPFQFYEAAYFLPTDKIKVDTSGEMLDRFRIRYMDGDGTDLRYREWFTGGLAPVPTDDISELNVNYEAVMGLEVLGAEHFAKMTLAQS